MSLLECVANVSEGINATTISALKVAIAAHCNLLHTDTSSSAHRTVFTFAGLPADVVAAAFALCQSASELIDMRQHHGAHPRLGAVDVLPLIPIKGVSPAEAKEITLQLGERLASALQIPIYLYEQSAAAPHRAALPQVRKGQYEGLSTKMLDYRWAPDFYFPAATNDKLQRSGAIILGVRSILVAYNISLDTSDARIAQTIAQQIRSSGYTYEGKRIAGKFPALRAIGWYLEEFESAQVSCNFLDYRVTSPLAVWQAVQALAQEYGTTAIGCEVIGLIPKECILQAGRFSKKINIELSEAELMTLGIATLKLDVVKPFDPELKILEYVLYNAGLCADRSAISAMAPLS